MSYRLNIFNSCTMNIDTRPLHGSEIKLVLVHFQMTHRLCSTYIRILLYLCDGVFWSFATLWRVPLDVLLRVFDIACLAVNTAATS